MGPDALTIEDTGATTVSLQLNANHKRRSVTNRSWKTQVHGDALPYSPLELS
jgi:hypothetical protein